MSKGIYNEKYFYNHPEEAKKDAILYCVILVNKKSLERECIKIGITQGTSFKDVSKRAQGFKGYDLRIQKIVKGNLYDIFQLEQYLHECWYNKKHQPQEKFGGSTELFKLDTNIIKSIPDNIEGFKKNNP